MFEPGPDGNLIDFLATGKRSGEWDDFLDEVIDLARHGDRIQLKRRLIQYKREAQHWAPFGHPHVTLRLRMPIFLARQFVKHQVGGVWSEESRRYMSDEPEFYFEPVLMGRPDDVKQGAEGALADQHCPMGVMHLVTDIARLEYVKLVSGEYGERMAPEQSRQILTLNTMTGVTWTGSLLFWSRVCNQRLDAHAQGAAQTMAKQISDILRPLYPASWAALVD